MTIENKWHFVSYLICKIIKKIASARVYHLIKKKKELGREGKFMFFLIWFKFVKPRERERERALDM